MILVDSNVIIDIRSASSPFRAWAEELLADALAAEGIALNAIVLAELSVGRIEPEALVAELRSAGVLILDLPAAASVICAQAYTQYRAARRDSGGGNAPPLPLPDFFIGAHAELMGWKLATRDVDRYRVYFPKVELITP